MTRDTLAPGVREARKALSKALIEGSWKLIWAETYDPADNLIKIIAGLPAEHRLALAGVTIEALSEVGFDPPSNVCNACKHPGGDHDLGNWCLVCPRPTAYSFEARVAAGWCYFASMTEAQKWAYGFSRLATPVTPEGG